jgi:hypothetical protein
MENLNKIHVVVAAMGEDGEPHFVDVTDAARNNIPGAVESAFFWESAGIPDLPGSIGQTPADISFPLPGGSKFGLVCFPAHSAGKLDLRGHGPSDLVAAHEDPAMHKSKTIDYEVIISGKIDIVLPNGESRTLTPGSCLVMGGVTHAWKNHYDEPCIY